MFRDVLTLENKGSSSTETSGTDYSLTQLCPRGSESLETPLRKPKDFIKLCALCNTFRPFRPSSGWTSENRESKNKNSNTSTL